MSDTAALSAGPAAASVDQVQECDAWWGSYSGWTMMPSMLICFGLTGLIAWGSWQLLDKGWVRFSILSLAGTLWLLQSLRWCYRVFGYNYRLTTHRLFQSKGLFYQDCVEVNLASIVKIMVRRGPHRSLVGVGKVCLTLEDPNRTRVVLEGVRHPRQVAEHIRTLSEQARQRRDSEPRPPISGPCGP